MCYIEGPEDNVFLESRTPPKFVDHCYLPAYAYPEVYLLGGIDVVLVAAFLCSAASSPWRKTGSQLIVMELETTTTTSLLTSENILL